MGSAVNPLKVNEIARVIRFLETNPQIAGTELDSILEVVFENSPYPYTAVFFLFCNYDLLERIDHLDRSAFISRRIERIGLKMSGANIEYQNRYWEKFVEIHDALIKEDVYVSCFI